MRYDFQSELMLTSSCKGLMHLTVQWTAVAASSIVDICSFNCAARTLACATDDLATGMTAQAYHPTTPLPLRAILAKSHSMEGTDFPAHPVVPRRSTAAETVLPWGMTTKS